MGVPPSGSVAVAVQVSVVDVDTPVVGLTLRESMEGVVFSTLTDALSLSLPPSVSAAATAQVMVSPGAAVVGVRLREALDPSEVFWVSLVQA